MCKFFGIVFLHNPNRFCNFFSNVETLCRKGYYKPLLLISLLIKANSRPVCPPIDVFSCARRMRYGTTSFIGPNGRYLLTLHPALARLKVILSLIPYSWLQCT